MYLIERIRSAGNIKSYFHEVVNDFINPEDNTLRSGHLLDPLKEMIMRICKSFTQITPMELFESPVIYRLLQLRPELQR